MTSSELFWRTVSYVTTHRRALVALLITTLTYFINRFDVYALIATNVSMANDIHYGQRRCILNNFSAAELRVQQNCNSSCNNNLNQTVLDFCISNERLCENSIDACKWYYTGLGWEYQILAGPVYIILYSISAIPLGVLSEMNNVSRKMLLGVCCFIWGLMTIFGGLCTQYWQIIITRILLGVASAGCLPFAASIISDYFPKKRGAALGFFNFGVYAGFSLSFLLIIADKTLGWRAVYFIAGVPAVAIAILTWLAVAEPKRRLSAASDTEPPPTDPSSRLVKFRNACRLFLDPLLLLFSLGAAVRNGAALVWAFNIVLFFKEYHPDTKVEEWMSWISLIFGSLGAIGGGVLSDYLSRNRGTSGRLVILIACNVLSAPFMIATLYLPMPWAFIMQIPGFVIGEMWIGVAVAIVIDIVPADLTTSAVAIYFFIMQIIGGNMNVLITPLSDSFDYRIALLITFPGLYLLASVLFLLSLIVYICLRRKSHTVPRDHSLSAAAVNKGYESMQEGKATQPI